MMDTALSHALELIELGWYVFPCKPNKSPYTTHGMKDATTDPVVITHWWEDIH